MVNPGEDFWIFIFKYFDHKNCTFVQLSPYLLTMDCAPQTPLLRHVRDHNSKKDLTGHKRQQIVSALLCKCKDGALFGYLRHGALKDLAETFHVHPKMIKQIWTCAPVNVANLEVHAFRVSPPNISLVERRNGIIRKFAMQSKKSPFMRNERFAILLRLVLSMGMASRHGWNDVSQVSIQQSDRSMEAAQHPKFLYSNVKNSTQNNAKSSKAVKAWYFN